MEGKQHRTGVTTMDSKLTFGSASARCVHEVTGLKPMRWAVMEQLAKQFLRVSSSAGFLTLFVRLLMPVIVFCFLQGVNETRVERC